MGEDIKVEQKPAENEAQEPTEAEESSVQHQADIAAFTDDTAVAALKGYFGIESGLDAIKLKQLKFLVGWAAKNGIKTKADMLAAIRSEEYRLGKPNFGESRAGRLFRYLKLKGQQQDILKEMMVYEK